MTLCNNYAKSIKKYLCSNLGLGFQVNNVMGIQTHYPMFWEAFISINSKPILYIFNMLL